jgi:uncharacterized membrane-anchored protein YitT (DUF2179 family)
MTYTNQAYAGKKGKVKDFALRVVNDKTISTAVGLLLFFAGARLSALWSINMGGVFGASLILNELFGWNTTVPALLMNFTLLVIAWKVLSWEFAKNSLICLIFLTLLRDTNYLNVDALSQLPTWVGLGLSQVLIGAGIAIMLGKGKSSTGGSEAFAEIFRKFFPKVSTGMGMNIFDFMVVFTAAFFGTHNLLLSVAAVLVCNTTVDLVQWLIREGEYPWYLNPKKLIGKIRRKRKYQESEEVIVWTSSTAMQESAIPRRITNF